MEEVTAADELRPKGGSRPNSVVAAWTSRAFVAWVL